MIVARKQQTLWLPFLVLAVVLSLLVTTPPITNLWAQAAASPTTKNDGSQQAPECEVNDDCGFGRSSSSPSSEHNSHSWFEDASLEGLKFLQHNVFGQSSEQVDRRKDSFSHLQQHSGDDDDNTKEQDRSNDNSGLLATLSSIISAERPDEALFQVLLSRGSSMAADEDDAPSLKDTAQLFLDHAGEVLEQLHRTFDDRLGGLVKDYFFLPSAWYLLRKEQETKHAYWKHLQHRFCDKVTDTRVYKELHQALYLSDLAYVDSEPEIRDGLSKVENGTWELLFVDTKGNPSEPAHFLAVQKQTAPLKPPSVWDKATGRNLEEDSLKVLLVVRGTKTLADVLSDGLLEAEDYKDYKAHGGIRRSGTYIVEKHIDRLKELLDASGRSRLELYIFGHSLGAGTGAIAAMEFHDKYSDFITVQAVGFGCPSLVSMELSERYKDIITTVITDADVVPRMSGASLINLHLEMLTLDWTDYIMEELQGVGKDVLKDVTEWTSGAGTAFTLEVLEKIQTHLERHFQRDVKPTIQKAAEAIPKVIPSRRKDGELVPPGTCLHLYRTATGFEAAYTPCDFFREIEYVPHLVEDHMTGTGYHLALLSLLRHQLRDFNAVFENELVTWKKS